MRDARKGDIWIVDMGIAGKVRPCLLLTDFPADNELALITVLPHTTSLRGHRWELSIPKPFLKEGVFHFQEIESVTLTRLLRRLGRTTDQEWSCVLDKLAERFSL
jgi:mRNA interferase MazF